ncbi:MAG: hypothetical protein GWN74_13570 [Thermoplasmata archaeon]|nr:hypothetical protein [Thermoplasmata archaeon]
MYQCVVAGTSNSGEPTWDTTPGQDTTDNTVVWTEAGRGLVTLDAANVSWTSSTITARYAIIYKDTGTASTSPLIGFIDFGQDESTTNGTFQVTFDDDGIFQFFAGYGGT